MWIYVKYDFVDFVITYKERYGFFCANRFSNQFVDKSPSKLDIARETGGI